MIPRMRIALATGSDMPKADPESHLLVGALAQLGIEAELLPWDSPIDWSAYRLVVVRSPWDYFRRLDAFLDWCREVDSCTRLVNSPRVIEWNSHKRYLTELADAGLPVVPTLHLPRGCVDARSRLADRPWQQVVIKPAVSISAIGALRTQADSPEADVHLARLLSDGDVLVQPYVESIATAGEASLIFFGGIFSHAVRKTPKAGDYRVQDLYGGTVGAHRATNAEVDLGMRALAAAPAATAYARVDLVHEAGRPLIMELELIEPELFLAASTDAPLDYARTLASLLT